MPEDAYQETNRALWDRWTRLHRDAAFYDLEGFRAGRSTLRRTELEELGDVAGKSLLHFQCHFGLDTLSWARLGARVTGVDFSDEAITLARTLARETRLEADFIRANVYDLPDVLSGAFDIVFTSYGVLPWLPDLPRWAAVVAHFLRPGGTFYMVEFHPFAETLDDDGRTLRYPYFHTPTPLRIEQRGSYAAPEPDLVHPAYFWTHPLGDVVSALAGAGLVLEFLHEFPFSAYGCFPWLERRDDGQWRPRSGETALMYSVRATRVAEKR